MSAIRKKMEIKFIQVFKKQQNYLYPKVTCSYTQKMQWNPLKSTRNNKKV